MNNRPKGPDHEVKPKVLLLSTCNWISPARLAMALANAGFSVEGLCPSGHLLRQVSVVERLHRYNALLPLRSVGKAIKTAHPDLLLPCDDLATRHLHDLHRKTSESGQAATVALIERSLGAPSNYHILEARMPFMELASREGIRSPKTEVVRAISELEKSAKQNAFPLVLKADGTASGEGVAIVRSLEQAHRAFQALQAPPKFVRTIKWVIINHNLHSLLPMLFRRKSVVNAQSYVQGREATTLVACSNGKVLAALHFEVVCTQRTAGPASVLRLIEHPEMSAAAEKMVCRLQLSGVHGFDFMIEEGTGHAYLIEINPRATQVGHLALGPGRDLPAALYSALTGKPVKPAQRTTGCDVIALFPQLWLTNPASAFLRSAYHDVPWEEPNLVRSCLKQRSRVNAWLSQRKLFRAIWGPSLPRL